MNDSPPEFESGKSFELNWKRSWTKRGARQELVNYLRPRLPDFVTCVRELMSRLLSTALIYCKKKKDFDHSWYRTQNMLLKVSHNT